MTLSNAERQRQRRYMEQLKGEAPVSFGPDTSDEEIARMLIDKLGWEKIMRILIAINHLAEETERAAGSTRRGPRRKR
jgi:ActR/RegA family two-component response regulator